jgi:hypothetical protein
VKIVRKFRRPKKDKLSYREIVMADSAIFIGYCFKKQVTGHGIIKYLDQS